MALSKSLIVLKRHSQAKRVFVTFCGADCQGCAFRAEEGMRKKIKLAVGPGIEVEEIDFTGRPLGPFGACRWRAVVPGLWRSFNVSA